MTKYLSSESKNFYEAVGRWEPTPLLMRLVGNPPERRKKFRFQRNPEGLISEGWEYR